MEKRDLIANHIKKYEIPTNGQGLYNLSFSFALYFLSTHLEEPGISWITWTFILILRSFCYLRLFVTLHDLGHYAYFSSMQLNIINGYIVGSLIGVPYNFWRFYHLLHHNFTNNLNFYQYGQSAPLTLQQFLKLSKLWQQLYKFSYSTKGIVLVLPLLFRMFFYFRMHEDKVGVITLLGTLAVKHFVLHQSLLLDQLALHLASFYGVLIFHIQHTFPELRRTYFKDTFMNGLTGSTFLQVPRILNFFTHGIEYHHIHHINSQVPAYELAKCHEALEIVEPGAWELVKKVTIKDMFCTNLLVYDERRGRLITEKELEEVLEKREQAKQVSNAAGKSG